MNARRNAWLAPSMTVTATMMIGMIAQVCWNSNARMISHSNCPILPAPTSPITDIGRTLLSNR